MGFMDTNDGVHTRKNFVALAVGPCVGPLLFYVGFKRISVSRKWLCSPSICFQYASKFQVRWLEIQRLMEFEEKHKKHSVMKKWIGNEEGFV